MTHRDRGSSTTGDVGHGGSQSYCDYLRNVYSERKCARNIDVARYVFRYFDPGICSGHLEFMGHLGLFLSPLASHSSMASGS
jgi:hypothetical protein